MSASTRAKTRWLVLPIILAAIPLVLVFQYWSEQSKSQAYLLRQGKVAFYRGGFFSRDQFELIVWRGQWHLREPDVQYVSDELAVPFECEYSKACNLRFEEGGRLFWINKGKNTREELKVVQGEWSYDAGDHWQSIYEVYDIIGVPGVDY